MEKYFILNKIQLLIVLSKKISDLVKRVYNKIGYSSYYILFRQLITRIED